MTWELVTLKPHPHRPDGEEAHACLYKSVARVEKDGLNAVQYIVRVAPLPLVAGQGPEKKMVKMEDALFKVVADLNEQKVLFDIGGADAALPTLLRGGGLGSLAISELIQWAQKQFGEFAVANGRISPAILNYTNAEPNAVRCLQNFGFTVGKASRGGLSFGAERVDQLKTHVNTGKVENANPALWFASHIQDNLSIAQQLKQHGDEVTLLKEQLHQTAQHKRSAAPFVSGLLMGVVAGSAFAAMLFSV